MIPRWLSSNLAYLIECQFHGMLSEKDAAFGFFMHKVHNDSFQLQRVRAQREMQPIVMYQVSGR